MNNSYIEELENILIYILPSQKQLSELDLNELSQLNLWEGAIYVEWIHEWIQSHLGLIDSLE